MEIVVILGLILLNGCLSLAEIALVSARKARLESEARKGKKSAQTALKLAHNPDKFLLSNSAPRRIRPVAPLHRGSVEVYDGDDEMTAKDRLEVRDAGRSFFVSESSLEMRAHQPGAAFSML